MKLSIAYLQHLCLLSNCLSAQKSEVDKYLSVRPSEIRPEKTKNHEYSVTLKWQNLDAIEGNKFNCNAVSATYIIGLENDSVGWKDVSMAQISDFQQKDFNGTYFAFI